MPITAEELVRGEVYHNVCHLVSTLAGGYGCTPGRTTEHKAIDELCEQAFDLAAPMEDWEGAAREAGWKPSSNPRYFNIGQAGEPMQTVKADGWQGLCEEYDIEPHYLEVYEHWIVTSWLADKLIAKGEKVDKDFAGLTVWARTTTGQAIYLDDVIEQIAADMG